MKPRRVAGFQFYQTLHNDTRIAPVYEQRLAEAVREAGDTTLDKAARMALRQQVVKEAWESESKEEQDRVHTLAEADYQRRKTEHAAGLAPPTTPEEYEQ